MYTWAQVGQRAQLTLFHGREGSFFYPTSTFSAVGQKNFKRSKELTHRTVCGHGGSGSGGQTETGGKV